MNIDLQGLYINGFRDIGSDQTVDIPKNTLCSVSGKNEDSGGSNGSGKTSLILSDKIALFGPKFVGLTGQDCKNRHLDDITQVTARLAVGNKNVQVSRTIGGKLILSVDGVVTEGKVDDIQPRIEKLLEISPEHLSYLTYKAQGDYGGFIKMKDAEKKDFLGQFFNLGKIEVAGEKIAEKLKTCTLNLTETSTKIESLRQFTDSISQDIEKIVAQISSPETYIKKEKITVDKKTLETKQYELMMIRTAIKNYKQPQLPAAMIERQNVIITEIQSITNKTNKSTRAIEDLHFVAQKLSDTKYTMGHAKEGKCHACGQSIKAHDADQIMAANVKKMEDLTAKANLLRADLVDIDAMDNRMAELRRLAEEVAGEISIFKNSNNKKELESTESKLNEIVSAVNNSIESDERYLGLMARQLKDVKEKHEKALLSHSELEVSFKKLSEEKKILEESAKILSRSGFLGYIFDSVLDEINYETNLNLQMIPNVKHLRVYFSPDKAIKSTGGTSKEIACTIYDGSIAVSLKSLSGGEDRSTCIAVDEAVDTVLSRRLGVHMGWKFLDEPFDAIDNSSKEALLEFFRLKSSSKTYLIVDHSSEFNAAVDKRIVVTKRNGIATING